MEYLNVLTSFIMSAEFRGCEPVDRATWLSLAGFCALVENGGKIDACRSWKPRRCEMTLGVTRAEMHRECELWSWEGDALIVHFYPAAQEAKVILKRGVARTNGRLGGRPAKTEIETNIEAEIGSDKKPNSEPISKPISKPISESVKERKGKEGKGNERESARENDHAETMEDTARRIVEIYPRREGVAESLPIVFGHLRDGEPAEAMLAGTRAAAVVIATAPSGHLNRYVPSALKFFRGKRWKDDPATLIRPPEVNGGKGVHTQAELAALLGPRGNAAEFGY